MAGSSKLILPIGWVDDDLVSINFFAACHLSEADPTANPNTTDESTPTAPDTSCPVSLEKTATSPTDQVGCASTKAWIPDLLPRRSLPAPSELLDGLDCIGATLAESIALSESG